MQAVYCCRLVHLDIKNITHIHDVLYIYIQSVVLYTTYSNTFPNIINIVFLQLPVSKMSIPYIKFKPDRKLESSLCNIMYIMLLQVR